MQLNSFVKDGTFRSSFRIGSGSCPEPVLKELLESYLTQLWRADEVTDAANTAIIFSLWLVQLHPDPLAAGELSCSAEPQSSRLRIRRKRSLTDRTQITAVEELLREL